LSPIPVTVITGFLGSGKTTLLAALLRRPEMADTAVVINEFGEVGLDHLLIESSDETVVELASGCICCTIRGDLANTLCDLLARRRSGDVPAFERVVIETTGLADPAPILQVIMNDPLLAEALRLERVIATVDALAGLETLGAHPESVKQAAVADHLVLTKTDLLSAVPAMLERRLRALNPAAEIHDGRRLDIARLFGIGDAEARSPGRRIDAWLGRHEQHHVHGESRHDQAINSFVIVREAPVRAVTLALFLETLSEHCGRDLLRLKGLVQLAEAPERPAVIHGVQHVFHPPVWLDAWPSADRRSRVVLITRGLSRAWVETLLEMLDEEVAALQAA